MVDDKRAADVEASPGKAPVDAGARSRWPGRSEWIVVSILLAVGILGVAIANIGRFQKTQKNPRHATPSEMVSSEEFDELLAAGKFVDISNPSLNTAGVKLPRIPSSIESVDTTPSGLDVVFEFGGSERRVECDFISACVFTDGETCAVVQEHQCATPVRITKMDKDGNVIYEVSENYHAHCVATYSPQRGIIYVWITDNSEVRAFDWETGEARFSIAAPLTYAQPTLAVSDDEKSLYFFYHKMRYSNQKWTTDDYYHVHKYDIAKLGKPESVGTVSENDTAEENSNVAEPTTN